MQHLIKKFVLAAAAMAFMIPVVNGIEASPVDLNEQISAVQTVQLNQEDFKPDAVAKSDKSIKKSGNDLSNLTIPQLGVELEKQRVIMEDAAALAKTARDLGMPEDSETIVSAKGFYKEANESCTEIQSMIDWKKAEAVRLANQATMTYTVNKKTNLSADAFNRILANTPLAGHGQDFRDMEQTCNVNGLFAASVGYIESSLGRSSMARNQNNYFGMIGRSFDSPHSGIMAFGHLMNNGLYYGKSIEGVGKTYCPGSWQNWANNNRAYMDSFWAKAN